MPDDGATLTVRQVADAMAILTMEIVAAVSKDTEVADARLETIASSLMEFADGMPVGATHALVVAVGEMLIGTEQGAEPNGWTP